MVHRSGSRARPAAVERMFPRPSSVPATPCSSWRPASSPSEPSLGLDRPVGTARLCLPATFASTEA